MIGRGSTKVKRKTLLFPSLLCVAIVAVLFVPSANARGGTFVIQPKQEAVEAVNPVGNTPPFGVAGRISANSSVDFYVTSPSGAELLSYIATNDTSFSFTEQENGIYQIHLANTHSTENVTVVLTYGFIFETTSYVNLHVGATSQSSAAIPPIPPPPPDSPDNPDRYDPYAYYLNFLRASEILRSMNEDLQIILPINRMSSTVIYSMLFMYAFGIVAMRLNKIRTEASRVAKARKTNFALMDNG